eukprot:Opistho-2@56991
MLPATIIRQNNGLDALMTSLSRSQMTTHPISKAKVSPRPANTTKDVRRPSFILNTFTHEVRLLTTYSVLEGMLSQSGSSKGTESCGCNPPVILNTSKYFPGGPYICRRSYVVVPSTRLRLLPPSIVTLPEAFPVAADTTATEISASAPDVFDMALTLSKSARVIAGTNCPWYIIGGTGLPVLLICVPGVVNLSPDRRALLSIKVMLDSPSGNLNGDATYNPPPFCALFLRRVTFVPNATVANSDLSMKSAPPARAAVLSANTVPPTVSEDLIFSESRSLGMYARPPPLPSALFLTTIVPPPISVFPPMSIANPPFASADEDDAVLLSVRAVLSDPVVFRISKLNVDRPAPVDVVARAARTSTLTEGLGALPDASSAQFPAKLAAASAEMAPPWSAVLFLNTLDLSVHATVP